MTKSSAKSKQPGSKRSLRKREQQEAAKQTKKQIALGRKEARQNRIIWVGVGLLCLLVLIIVVVGAVTEVLIKPSTPVATVNGVAIRTDDYEALVRYQRHNTHLNIQDLQSGLQSLDATQEGNEFLITFYQQQLEQLQTALLTIPQTALDELIDDQLIRGFADEEGIALSDGEVEQSIMDDLRRAASPQSTETTTDTVQLPTPTPIPQADLEGFYENILASMDLSDKEFRTIVGRGLLRTKVQELLASQVETTGLVAHVQTIQTDSEEEAVAAKARIEDGEDFGDVAAEVSTDPGAAETGGDLGWITPGQFLSRYGEQWDTMVFSLTPGALGLAGDGDTFYVIRVLEKDENGPLPEAALSERRYSALDDWLEEQRASPDVQIDWRLEASQIPPDPFLGY
jgi:parvulin-like peptidyl-prolyl isomerase